MQSKLAAFGGDFSSIDIIRIAIGSVTPTLGTLQTYDAVLVFTDAAIDDPTEFGDVLADYVDAGGGVVMAAFSTGVAPVGGRFLSDGYYCIPGGFAQSSKLTLRTIHEPTSQLLDNVTSFGGGTSSFHGATDDVEPGCPRVADWSNNVPLLATKTIGGTPRADINFYPPSIDSGPEFWVTSTDGGQLMRNAFLYSANVIPVAIEPTIGMPTTHVLSLVYPNPFNPHAQFSLSVTDAQHVRASLYDVRGREVVIVVDEVMSADQTKTFVINGNMLPSGLYHLHVTTLIPVHVSLLNRLFTKPPRLFVDFVPGRGTTFGISTQRAKKPITDLVEAPRQRAADPQT